MSRPHSEAADESRPADQPWPAIALAAFGAWMCAALLALAMFALTLGTSDAAPRVVLGAGFFMAAMLSLRIRSASTFVEQLFLPLFAVGLGTLAWALPSSLSEQLRTGLVGSLCLGVAICTQRAMLQTLLGAVGIAGCLAAVAQSLGLREWTLLSWLVALLAAGCWWCGQRVGEQRWQLTWARIGSGAALLALFLAAWQSGWAMGAGQAMGANSAWSLSGAAFGSPAHLICALLGLGFAGVASMGAKLPSPALSAMPKAASALALGALACLCLLQPWFGLCFALAWLAAAWGQRAMSGVAAFAALWTVLAIYGLQQPSFNLKALMLGAAGALLVASAWLMRPAGAVRTGATQARRTPWAMLFSVAAVCLVVGIGTVQKERIRSHGETVLVPLAPVDPRSIMQGDYMSLAFDMGNTSVPAEDQRGSAEWVAQIAPRDGVESVLQALRHQAPGMPIAANERRLKLRVVQSRWSMPTNAFFFPEGTGSRFELARFGIFKLGRNGDTVLIGLADAKGRPIK